MATRRGWFLMQIPSPSNSPLINEVYNSILLALPVTVLVFLNGPFLVFTTKQEICLIFLYPKQSIPDIQVGTQILVEIWILDLEKRTTYPEYTADRFLSYVQFNSW